MCSINKYSKLCLALLVGCGLSACSTADRIARIGQQPEMSEIANPQTQPGYQPVSMPMPAPRATEQQLNSLWTSNRRSFFEDQRAKDAGDILTVVIKISDKAQLDNDTERTRSSTENSGLDQLLGYEASLDRILPQAVDNTNLSALDAESTYTGEGSIDRKEKIEVKLAASVIQVLPNGNLVIAGRQEIAVNYEKRIVQITGIVRPEDISVENSVDYERVAEARITYGGEGQISDVQQPRYGQQLYDILFPF